VSARRARPEEWERLRDLRLRALREEPQAFHARYEDEKDDAEAEWRDWLRRSAIFVAGEYEGMCGASTREDGDVQLFAMYVPPECRGRGHGRTLVSAVEAWARERGARRVVLWVAAANDAARSLYETGGFAETGERRDDGGVLLARPLD
jgi:ribosomal protein S18 acetylase RimI-like enzyme